MKFNQKWLAGIYDSDKGEALELFAASVPGNVQKDYADYKGIDIMFSDNVEALEAVEDVFWIYKTKLDFKAESGDSVFFVAEGIDYIFDIILDGKKLHSQEGMYTKVELDITEEVKPGSELSVLIHPHPKRSGYHETPRQEADQSCKPPVSYGWDWNPRLLISGIWKPAYIETRKRGFINSVEPFYTLDSALENAEVRFETVCDEKVVYTLFDPDGNVVYSGESPEFTVNNVKLWWCSGQGEPHLYKWTAESSTDKKEGKIGFRKVRMLRNPGTGGDPAGYPMSRYAAPVTIELNGRRIFAKGSNWVNPELFFGVITEERYEELIKAAVDANMNIFRLWGGAGIQKDEFYDICDRLGIMVWQEFMLACNNYVANPHYMEVLEREAMSIIIHLRRHPSLVIWCGGNELFNSWSGMDDQSRALRLLNKLCFELDYERPFFPTSPLTGMAHGGYTFFDKNTGEDVFGVFQNRRNTAYTEFGVPSAAGVNELKKIIPENELFPITKTKSWEKHHGFSAWGYDTWLCLETDRKLFGEPESLEQFVDRSQRMQATGYKEIFEETRRQWPGCSMSINWCWCEPWITAANNSLVCYPMVLKPAYYAVKESLRPVAASARVPKFDWTEGELFSCELWLLNDSNEPVSDTIRASLIIGGCEYELGEWKTGKAEPRTNIKGTVLEFKMPKIEKTGFMTLKLITETPGRSSEYELLCRA